MCKLRNLGNPVSHVNSLFQFISGWVTLPLTMSVGVRPTPPHLSTPHINDFVNKHRRKPSLHLCSVCEHTYALYPARITYRRCSLRLTRTTKSSAAQKLQPPSSGLENVFLQSCCRTLVRASHNSLIRSGTPFLHASFASLCSQDGRQARLQELDAMWLSFGF